MRARNGGLLIQILVLSKKAEVEVETKKEEEGANFGIEEESESVRDDVISMVCLLEMIQNW